MLSLKKALTQDLDAQVEQIERRLEDEKRRNKEELDQLRRQMVRVARGGILTAEAILDKRLFNEVAPKDVTTFVSDTADLLILDVRSDGEWAGGRIPGAVHIPIDQLGRRLPELQGAKTKPILAYCAAGGRSAAACDLLSQHGFVSLFNAGGGVGAYKGKLEK